MTVRDGPAVAHCRAEGYDLRDLPQRLQETAAVFADGDHWDRGEDDDPVEFGMVIGRDGVSLLDEEVFDHVATIDEANEEILKSVKALAKRGVIGSATVEIDVQLDAGLEANEFTHLEDQR